MDEDQPEHEGRLVLLSSKAASDFAAIHTYTAVQWDFDQAERYAEFLKLTLRQIADDPLVGNLVASREGFYEHVVRWKRARHGHRIVYQPVPEGIYVLRILHTAMNWLEHLSP